MPNRRSSQGKAASMAISVVWPRVIAVGDPGAGQARGLEVSGDDLVDQRHGQVDAERGDRKSTTPGGRKSSTPASRMPPRPRADRQRRRVGQRQAIERRGRGERRGDPRAPRRPPGRPASSPDRHHQRDHPAGGHPAGRPPRAAPSRTPGPDRRGCASPASCPGCRPGPSRTSRPGTPRTARPPSRPSPEARITSSPVPRA